MGKKISIGLSVVAGLLGFVILVGQGPFVDIPADAAIGKEYPFPDEARIAEETAELVLSSIKEKEGAEHTLRDAHPFAHGCVRGTFSVQGDLPAEFKHGLFATPATYPVWIRYSNGGTTRKPDADGDIRGMAIKLMNVPGPKIQDDETGTQDFLVISHTVLPVGDPGEYLALFKAALAKKPMSYLLGGAPWNWKLSAFKRIIDIRRKKIPNMLLTRFWSTVPYQLGATAVKYSARPCNAEEAAAAKVPDNPSATYLRETMVSYLKEKSACFEFMVQPQTDARKMPVEDPAVEWDETASPFVPVAKIEIPAQTFDTPAQNEFCENLTFNPWHSLPAHRPLGSINRVRKLAYERVSRYRLERNGIQRREPTGKEAFAP